MGKITISYNGKLDSRELKNKLIQLFPEGCSIIYDAGEPIGEPTRFQKIKAMGLEDMAEYNVKRTRVVDEYDDSQYYIQVTSDGTCFKDNERGEAVAHEIAWLNGFESEGKATLKDNPKGTQEIYSLFRKEIDKYSIPLIVEDMLELVEFISVDGEIVGMCGGTSGYIDCLYVLPQYRRQGYAKKLALSWYERYKNSNTPTRLHIVNNNVPALRFWNSVFELKEVDCSPVDTLYEIIKVRE